MFRSSDRSCFASTLRLRIRGVRRTPSIPDMLALKIAAGILPLAIDTITTEEETVEGNAHRNRMPISRLSL